MEGASPEVLELKSEADGNFRQEDYDKAIVAYKQAVELDDTRAVLFNNIALCYKKTQQWDQVLEHAEKALALDPDYIKSLNCMGQAIVMMAKVEQGYEALDRMDEGIDSI